MKSFKKNLTSVLAIVAISGGTMLVGIQPARAATNDLSSISASEAVSLLTDGNPGIYVIPGSEVAYGSMKSFTSINLSPGFELPDSGILLNSHTSAPFGADNSTSPGQLAIRSKLDSILSANSVNALTTNVSALSFSFTSDPSVASILVDFIFASTEYFNSTWDVAALIVDDTNYAYLSNGNILRVRPESNLCNFYIYVNSQNPDPECAYAVQQDPYLTWNNYLSNASSPFNSMSALTAAAAPTARIAGLLNQSLTTHTVTFAVADTDDQIVPSFFMFSPVRASTQAFAGISAQLTSTPDAPASVTATATGKTTASVSFEAPAYDGDSTITSYTATSSPGGITKTLTQAGGGTFEFTGLTPGTAYTFSVNATNAIGTSTATTSNSIKTLALVVASLSSLTFADDGTGTGGKIVWAGKNIDAVLFTGPASAYPGPYNYGAFSSGWNGRIRNLTPDTSYTVSIFAISSDGVGESKSLTFKTSAILPSAPGAASATISRSESLAAQMSNLSSWIDANTFLDGEGAILKKMLSKFDGLTAPSISAYLKLPNSSVAKVSATSTTPTVCAVEGQLTVRSIATGTCTIAYTVTGGSNAPATMFKDFIFKKYA